MKERPILFNAPMVRALMAGTKTQTRRIVKPVKFYPDFGCAVGQVGGAWRYGSPAALGLRERGDHWSVVLKGDVLQRMCTSEAYGWGAGAGCPYGVPGGDRLYVRETWAAPHAYDHLPPRLIPQDARIHYAATEDRGGLLWRPSIHMPRWASRITLEVTGVRVEQLQEISYEDARAEGAEFWRNDGTLTELPPCSEHRYAFEDLWTGINGADSWNANPWVWVVSFRRLDAKEPSDA